MTLEDFLQNCNKFKVPKLKPGKAENIEELYEKVIKKSLPKKEIIEGWHQLLLQYVEQEDATFFIRRYSSAPNKDWSQIRRGFLTEHSSGLKYVFCDNYFAHYFYLMSLMNFVPTLQEFSEAIMNRKFPYGYMKTSAEAPYQAYPKGKAVNINSSGWKLAHLFSVNQNDYNFNYREECKELFPRGQQGQWKMHPGKDYPARIMEEPHTLEMRKKTVAHFLRLVHPMNYFLVPKVNLSSLNIGEYPEVLSFMRKQALNRFGTMFEKYRQLIMADDLTTSEYSSVSFDFRYGYSFSSTPTMKKKPIETKSQKTRNYLSYRMELNYCDNDLAILKAYLMDAKSFRTIEMEFMGLESPVRGGGFKAKKILNEYGVEARDKGIVTKNNIKDLIETNEGLLKQSLKELNRFLENTE